MAIDDLEFWYLWRFSELGLHGINYAAAPSSGRAVDDTGYTEKHIASATRARRVSDVLERLPHDQQRVLRASYTPLLPAVLRELHGAYGDLAGIVLLLAGPEDARAVAADRSAIQRQAELRAQARAALATAERAYLSGAGCQRDDERNLRAERLEALRARLSAA